MKIYCPYCSGVSELTTVPREGQNIECPYCNQKFSYSVRMSMLRTAKKIRNSIIDTVAVEVPKKKEDTPKESISNNRIFNNLVECIDCGHKISKRARICPNCGAPIGSGDKTVQNRYYEELLRERNNKSEKNRLVYLILALILGAISVHNFYRGYILKGFIRIGILLGSGVMYVVFSFCFAKGLLHASKIRAYSCYAMGELKSTAMANSTNSSFWYFLGCFFLLITFGLIIYWIVLWILDFCSPTDSKGKKMYIE